MPGVQLALLVAVLAIGFGSGAIPLRRRAGDDDARARLLEWGGAFAAGVFLGAGLIHMLPDATEAWERIGWNYPIGFVLAAAAILVMLLFEHVLLPDEAHHAMHAPSADRFASPDSPSASQPAAYAILTALSVHSLLEGIALGVQSELGDALVLFAAIAAHKAVAGFALGVSLARSSLPAARAWTLLAGFALATPLGMLAGATAGALEGRMRDMLEAGFLSMAAGTFVYVATLDILREEFEAEDGRRTKWLWVAAGTGVMAVLAFWV